MEYSAERIKNEFEITLPERWEKLFPEVYEEYKKSGHRLLTPEYYDYLKDSYGMLEDLVDIYKSSAEAVKKNEPLAILAAIVARAIHDRALFPGELRLFTFPKPKEGEESLAYDMLPALLMTEMADDCYENLTRRGLPKEHIDRTMKSPEASMRSFLNRNGRPGYSLFDWNQHHLDAKLFRLGRLQIHMNDRFGGFVQVFKSDTGDIICLADGIPVHRDGLVLGSYLAEDTDGSFEAKVTETEEYYEGYPYAKDGRVRPEKIRLLKSKHEKVLGYDDYVIKLHIPSGSPLDDAAVEESLKAAREFAARYYPEFDYKGFSCFSWLCDPALVDLLGEGSNISKFCKRFIPLTVRSSGREVFRFAYGNENIDFAGIPETTSLGRALKKHYAEGKAIYDFRGFFLK